MLSLRAPVRHALRVGQLAAGIAVISVACSSFDNEPAASPATTAPTETLGVTTVPADSSTTSSAPPETVQVEPGSGDGVPDQTIAAVSFGSDVLPILQSNCASCHTADGPGAAHLSLETAQDATGFDADYIAAVIEVGYMPPWPADDGDVAFHGDRRLSDADMAAVANWAEQGAVLDIDPATPIEAPPAAGGVLDRDAVLIAAPYKGSVGNDIDDYRCQIYDPGITENGYLESFAVEADRTEVVHHALLFHADAEARSAAEAQDAADPDIGWSCTALAGFGDPGESDLIMSWAPGQEPTELPAGVGIELTPGDFFVMQIHYHYEPEWADLPPDESRLVLDYADDDTIAEAGGTLEPIELELYLAPAEIPCSTDEVGPLCDRDAAKAALLEEAGPFAAFVGDGLLQACGASVSDFAEMTDGIATASCVHGANPGEIISIWAHQHEIGSAFKMTLNPGEPDEVVLLDIPRWSFDWQLNYEPIERIVLERGDRILVECEWDRARLPDDAEPRYIMWSEGTADEMCYSQIITRPA
ncbi:MAG: c-type cytochrome [Ilumatobacter sp.]